MIVSDKGQVANILLEQGDIVVIPERSDLIQIGGEVMMPQALVYNPKATVEDYVAWAGGYSERANYKRPMILKANGMVKPLTTLSLKQGIKF